MSFIELMVAIVILAFGVLGLAAGADTAQRAMVRGRLRTEMAVRAGLTVDSLRGRACGLTSGARGSDAEQAWSVESRGSVRYIVDSAHAGERRFTTLAALPCP